MDLIDALNWRYAAKRMNGRNVPQEKVDKLPGLDKKGLRSVAMLAPGYRDEENDFLANAEKVRREKNKLFLNIE